MCGRFTLTASPEEIAVQFAVEEPPLFKFRYNIAPTQTVPVVRIRPESMKRELVQLRWGLIPSWSKDVRIGNQMINAKAETVATKPSFRSAFRKRRCLIPASGFYEWQQQGRQKQPIYIRLCDRRPFAFAGLWERWEPKDGEPVESCTIITTEPNEFMKSIHNRMPVILSTKNYDVWLDPAVQQADSLQAMLKPCPVEEMEAYAVSIIVNNPRIDNLQCVEPV
jgi:putative SOS response-associated peptidase YedK